MRDRETDRHYAIIYLLQTFYFYNCHSMLCTVHFENLNVTDFDMFAKD